MTTIKKAVTISAISLTVFLGIAATVGSQTKAAQPTSGTPDRVTILKHVYTVCKDSQQSISGSKEEACGKAQDQTQTEFLCKEMSTASDNNCWVEDKSTAPDQPYLVYGVRN